MPKLRFLLALLAAFFATDGVWARGPVLESICADNKDVVRNEIAYRTHIAWGDARRADFYRWEIVALDGTGGYYPQHRDQNSAPGFPDRGFYEHGSKYPLRFFLVGMTRAAAQNLDRNCARDLSGCRLDLSFGGIEFFTDSVLSVPSFARAPSCDDGSRNVALMIADGDYPGRVRVAGHARETGPLPTPEMDASALGQRLEKLGYVVEYLYNVDRDRIAEAVGGLKNATMPDEHRLIVYYAGHGVSQDGAALLVPLPRSSGRSDMAAIADDSISASEIAMALPEARRGFNALILDMCRSDSELTLEELSKLRQAIPKVDADPISSLRLPTNTLVDYSTSARRLSSPGVKRSLYVDALLPLVVRSEESVVDVLSAANASVAGNEVSKNNFEQVPRLYGKIRADGASCLAACQRRDGD